MKDGIILPKVWKWFDQTSDRVKMNTASSTLAQVTYREGVEEGGREDDKPTQVSIEFKPTSPLL